MLASSLKLELHWNGAAFVWIHIAVGLTFFLLIVWHLQLHFQWKGWLRKLIHPKAPLTRWMAIFGALALITSIAATTQFLINSTHSPIGGWHGKIGLLFIVLIIIHILKRIKFYKREKNKR